MAYEYQTGQDPIDLSNIKEILPDELSGQYFQNLDAIMQRSDQAQLDRTLGSLSDRGFLRSGDTFSQVAENVLGPAQQRRNAILLPELRNAANAGREERLSATAFDRQKETMALQHQYQLDELDKQAQIKRMLLELEASMSGDGGGFDWEGLLGQVGGVALGSFAGGAGATIGGSLGKKLFSSTPTTTFDASKYSSVPRY